MEGAAAGKERRFPEDRIDHSGKNSSYHFTNKDSKFGTVGAVALDQYGNLAAAISTGGMTNKRFGRGTHLLLAPALMLITIPALSVARVGRVLYTAGNA